MINVRSQVAQMRFSSDIQSTVMLHHGFESLVSTTFDQCSTHICGEVVLEVQFPADEIADEVWSAVADAVQFRNLVRFAFCLRLPKLRSIM